MRVVFVHLGKSNPRHLWLNLRRHREIFPHVPVGVVVSDAIHEKRLPVGVDIIHYSQSHEARLLLNSLALGAGFRGGFWHLTLERLIALRQVHLEFEGEPMLHLESDVLLMPNFPWKEMAEGKTLMWGQISQNEDIAAILFSPNYVSTSALVEMICDQVTNDPKTSDMRALHKIAANLNKDDFSYIPQGLDASRMAEGIFDVGSIGMWLCGIDERNSWGRRNFFMSLAHHFVEPASYKYEIKSDGLWLRRDNQDLKLFSLHVHSKDLKLFGRTWHARLEELVRRSEYQIPKSEFYIRGFLSNLKEIWSEIFSARGVRALRKRLLGF